MPDLGTHTAAHEGEHPQFINAGIQGEVVTICVRSPAHRGKPGDFARMSMTRAQFNVWLDDVQHRLRGQ